MLLYILMTYSKGLVVFKHINVVHGEARLFQNFGGGKGWSENTYACISILPNK